MFSLFNYNPAINFVRVDSLKLLVEVVPDEGHDVSTVVNQRLEHMELFEDEHGLRRLELLIAGRRYQLYCVAYQLLNKHLLETLEKCTAL